MKKLKSYINELLCFIVLGHLVFLMACGSAGGIGLGPSENVFPPNAELIGDWELQAEVTESDCDGMPVGSTSTAVITVSEDSCGYDDDYNYDGVIVLEDCQAEFDSVDLNLGLSDSNSGCYFVYEETVELTYDPDADELTGTLSIDASLTGNCDGEVINLSCHVSGVVRTMVE